MAAKVWYESVSYPGEYIVLDGSKPDKDGYLKCDVVLEGVCVRYGVEIHESTVRKDFKKVQEPVGVKR